MQPKHSNNASHLRTISGGPAVQLEVSKRTHAALKASCQALNVLLANVLYLQEHLRYGAASAQATRRLTSKANSTQPCQSEADAVRAELAFFALFLQVTLMKEWPVAFLYTSHVTFSDWKHVALAFRGMVLPSASLSLPLISAEHAPFLKSEDLGASLPRQLASDSPFFVSSLKGQVFRNEAQSSAE